MKSSNKKSNVLVDVTKSINENRPMSFSSVEKARNEFLRILSAISTSTEKEYKTAIINASKKTEVDKVKSMLQSLTGNSDLYDIVAGFSFEEKSELYKFRATLRESKKDSNLFKRLKAASSFSINAVLDEEAEEFSFIRVYSFASIKNAYVHSEKKVDTTINDLQLKVYDDLKKTTSNRLSKVQKEVTELSTKIDSLEVHSDLEKSYKAGLKADLIQLQKSATKQTAIINYLQAEISAL